MSDYFLKANTADELYTTLQSVDIVMKNDGTYYAKPPYALDFIGTVHKPTGNTITQTSDDGTTFSYPEQAPIEGIHANLRANLTTDQEDGIAIIRINSPANPYRIWA